MIRVSVTAGRLREAATTLIGRLRALLRGKRAARIWRAITIVSLVTVSIAVYYAWRDLPKDQQQFRAEYLGLAVAIFLANYFLHLVGWHALAQATFGRLPFRDNVRAVAGSELVKYLPTVAWYIANRVHFYSGRQVASGAVVAASVAELAIMVASAAALYAVFWLSQTSSFSLGLIVLSILLVVALRWQGPRAARWWQRRLLSQRSTVGEVRGYWALAVLAYSGTWLSGAVFLAALLQVFGQVTMGDLPAILGIWLLASLAGYAASLTLGAVGVAREFTLAVLLARDWPLSVSATTAVLTKLVLTAGPIACSLCILGLFTLFNKDDK